MELPTIKPSNAERVRMRMQQVETDSENGSDNNRSAPKKRRPDDSSSSSDHEIYKQPSIELDPVEEFVETKSSLKKQSVRDATARMGDHLASPSKRTKFNLKKVNKKESNIRFGGDPELETMKRAQNRGGIKKAKSGTRVYDSEDKHEMRVQKV